MAMDARAWNRHTPDGLVVQLRLVRYHKYKLPRPTQVEQCNSWDDIRQVSTKGAWLSHKAAGFAERIIEVSAAIPANLIARSFLWMWRQQSGQAGSPLVSTYASVR